MRKKIALLLGLVLILSLFSCKQRPRSTAEVPPVLSHSYTVSVAPFSQPTHPQELIVGHLPENQGIINEDDLLSLNREFQHILISKPNRQFQFLKTPLKRPSLEFRNSDQPQGLEYWLNYGRSHNCDLLLVPQVLNWHERQGSKAGVTQSAWVRVEFFLLKVSSSRIMQRSIFEEKQQALSENFLNIADFLKRKGSWVSATDLAKEGMQKACKDLGL
ncbi:MAG: hypothetical protein IJU40_03130 [Desulfovibrionaceae bacterium]|nr:hypothetical protein [Desulfovibrionaceae bacterium]